MTYDDRNDAALWHLNQTPLHVAVAQDDVEKTRLLLSKGADPNAAAEYGLTPLHLAVLSSNREIARALLDFGAKEDVPDKYGKTPLDFAMGKDQAIYAALKARADQSALKRNALRLAAEQGDLERMARLVELGDDVNGADEKGLTPLHYAAVKNQASAAEWLLEHGAAIDAASAKGDSSLHLAAQKGAFDVARLLCQRGASVDRRNNDGKTPLYCAVVAGSFEIAKLMLEFRADPSIASKFNRTPRDEAVARRRDDLIALIDDAINSASQIAFDPTSFNINRVAIAGADENVRPEDLLQLSLTHPFVEWSILYDGEAQPLNRFPSLEWIAELVRLSREQVKKGAKPMRLSLHLCRKAVKALLRGSGAELDSIRNLQDAFERVQLNVVYRNEYQYLPFLPWNVKALLPHNPQIIIQLTGASINPQIGAMLKDANVDVAYLFDSSGGRGVTVKKYSPPTKEYCGYAGGLSPDNLKTEIVKIAAATGKHSIWLDMETGARDADDHFDLARVRKTLEIVGKWI